MVQRAESRLLWALKSKFQKAQQQASRGDSDPQPKGRTSPHPFQAGSIALDSPGPADLSPDSEGELSSPGLSHDPRPEVTALDIPVHGDQSTVVQASPQKFL